MIEIIVFIFGIIIGSFLNVLIYRLPRGIKFVKGRSFCPECKRKIDWWDNIPLLSFIILRRKCRYCQKKISWQYPIVELTTGILTVLIYNLQFSNNIQYPISNIETIFSLFLSLLLVWGLIVIFVVDIQHQIIPDEIIIFLVIIFFLRLFYPLNIKYLILNTKNYLIPAIGSSLFLYLIYLITHGKGMGFGDVKLAFLMGLVLGFPGILIAFYIAFLTGAFIGVILILIKKAKFGQKIPFGPFLVLGMFISYFYGWQIINIITKRFF